MIIHIAQKKKKEICLQQLQQAAAGKPETCSGNQITVLIMNLHRLYGQLGRRRAKIAFNFPFKSHFVLTVTPRQRHLSKNQ